jgi:hypothetical protein
VKIKRAPPDPFPRGRVAVDAQAEDVSAVRRARPHMGRGKNSSNLIFWHPRVLNEAPYVGTPGAASVSNLTSHSHCLDTFVLVVAATEMIESAALLKSLGIEEITPASGTDEVLRGHLE